MGRRRWAICRLLPDFCPYKISNGLFNVRLQAKFSRKDEDWAKDWASEDRVRRSGMQLAWPPWQTWSKREHCMSGLGGLNKSPDGVVIGLVQLQNPSVVTKEDLARQTDRICQLVGKARRNLSTMDLVVFPEYALHGLSMDTNPDIMCTLDGPEVGSSRPVSITASGDASRSWSSIRAAIHSTAASSSTIVERCDSTIARCIPGFRSNRGSQAISAFRSATVRTAARSR